MSFYKAEAKKAELLPMTITKSDNCEDYCRKHYRICSSLKGEIVETHKGSWA